MPNFQKILAPAIKTIVSQNKLQVNQLDAVAGMAAKLQESSKGPAGALKAIKDISAGLQKTLKLVEAQNDVMNNFKLPEDDDASDKETAEAVKEIEATIKAVVAENKKQLAEIDAIAKEVETAAKEGGDKDGGKKIKKATDLIDKARALVEEQSKLLEEAKKVLAG